MGDSFECKGCGGRAKDGDDGFCAGCLCEQRDSALAGAARLREIVDEIAALWAGRLKANAHPSGIYIAGNRFRRWFKRGDILRALDEEV